MFELVGRALLISFYSPLLLYSTIFIALIGFIYGYGVSFLFGIKKTIAIGFFVITLAAILILVFCSIFILYAKPITPIYETNESMELFDFLRNTSSSLMLLLSHFFINMCLGHSGLFFGIAFYFPSEWYLKKYKKISDLRTTTEEYETIVGNQQSLTTGTINLESLRHNPPVTTASLPSQPQPIPKN